MPSKEILLSVAIDEHARTYLEYMEKRKALSILTKDVEKLEQRLRNAVGTHEAATIMGDVVITNKPTARLRAKDLQTDNPDLYNEFVHPQVVDVFDAEEFKAAHPALYRVYQSRSFLFKEAGK